MSVENMYEINDKRRVNGTEHLITSGVINERVVANFVRTDVHFMRFKYLFGR